ncbi:hypothetical protein [Pseudomonas indica]|uniref:hypothetical protein n=1 Tax=Pseudomonas indica TaxID=137658 RepID=UPI0023F902F8|nr:hypothetical protein [Pseudomonas indica]MBU3057497.1 hypothetical protein [Pseudomonas indica]MBU3057498.1 hypothetical protein [Pseudomonas indica]
MAVNSTASSVNNTFVNESNQTAENQAQNLKDQGKFTRESQDAQTKSAMASVATENAKTAQNSQINASKGVQY